MQRRGPMPRTFREHALAAGAALGAVWGLLLLATWVLAQAWCCWLLACLWCYWLLGWAWLLGAAGYELGVHYLGAHARPGAAGRLGACAGLVLQAVWVRRRTGTQVASRPGPQKHTQTSTTARAPKYSQPHRVRVRLLLLLLLASGAWCCCLEQVLR